MSDFFDLGLRFGHTEERSPEERLADRVRLVLETRPGTLPWNPGFGCDLGGLLGHTVDQRGLDQIRLRIQTALNRYLPEATVRNIQVRTRETKRVVHDRRDIPFAETALASRGVSTRVEVQVLLETPQGIVSVEAGLDGN